MKIDRFLIRDRIFHKKLSSLQELAVLAKILIKWAFLIDRVTILATKMNKKLLKKHKICLLKEENQSDNKIINIISIYLNPSKKET